MLRDPSGHKKILIFPLLLVALFFSVSPVSANRTNDSSVVLCTTHKYAPGDQQAVNRTERQKTKTSINSLSRSPDMKKRPVVARKKVPAPATFRKRLSSRSAIILDAKSGEVLYAHDPDRPAQPASTIKVLTGLICIHSLRNEDLVGTSRYAAKMPRSKVYLRPGASYKADDLINAVLLASANDASVALAEKVAGSEKSFAKLMTYKARSLGAQNTVCKTATGLTAKGQKSTVRDLARVFSEAMEDREFARRMGKAKIRTSYGKVLRNHNKALWQVEGAVGGKTGYTRAARQTYVGKFVRDDTDLIVAIMGSETMWDDIRKLVEYGFARKQLLASRKGSDLAKNGESEREVALATLSTALSNKDLQVLSGSKKQPRM